MQVCENQGDVLEIAHRGTAQGEAKAHIYSLLSRCHTYPEQEFVSTIGDGSLAAAFSYTFGLLDDLGMLTDQQCDCADRFLRILQDLGDRGDGSLLLKELRVAYTGLFIGMPDPLVSPFESIQRGAIEDRKTLLFVDGATKDVERTYRAAGLAQVTRAEPSDHLAVELEFAHYLLSTGDEEGFRDFYEQHLSLWVPRFARETRSAADHEFYRGVSDVLIAVIEMA